MEQQNKLVIKYKVMQGTVWSGLMLTNTNDKLCKYVYKNHSLKYPCRGKVGDIDDIVTVSKCEATFVEINAFVIRS